MRENASKWTDVKFISINVIALKSERLQFFRALNIDHKKTQTREKNARVSVRRELRLK